MKYYILYGYANSKSFSVTKKFRTRNAAINYAFRCLPLFTEVNEEIVKDKHTIEYVCNNYSSFTVSRQVA
jgi:hypothetical protein